MTASAPQGEPTPDHVRIAKQEVEAWRAVVDLDRLAMLHYRRIRHHHVAEYADALAAAERRLAAVRELHRHPHGSYEGTSQCVVCKVPWPCPTIQAIEGE